jgi:hypothetical protein
MPLLLNGEGDMPHRTARTVPAIAFLLFTFFASPLQAAIVDGVNADKVPLVANFVTNQAGWLYTRLSPTS